MPVTLPAVGSMNWGESLNAAIQALAAANDAQKLTSIASGTDLATFGGVSNFASKVITFPAGRFSSPPVVTVADANSSINWISSIGGITANQFTCYIFRRDVTIPANGTQVAFHWIAVATT